MRHECIILAESPGALVEICGVSLLERLLRQLQRLGLTKAVVLSGTPELIAQHLARSSPNRAGVTLDIQQRTPEPGLTTAISFWLWPRTGSSIPGSCNGWMSKIAPPPWSIPPPRRACNL